VSVSIIQTKTGPRKVASLRKHIDAFCKHCIYDKVGGEGTWRQQVEACTSTKCPLYPVRPVSGTKEGDPVGLDAEEGDLAAEGEESPIQAINRTRMDLIESQMEDSE